MSLFDNDVFLYLCVGVCRGDSSDFLLFTDSDQFSSVGQNLSRTNSLQDTDWLDNVCK